MTHIPANERRVLLVVAEDQLFAKPNRNRRGGRDWITRTQGTTPLEGLSPVRVDRMERDGLIEVFPEERTDDGIYCVVRLTPKGEALVEQVLTHNQARA